MKDILITIEEPEISILKNYDIAVCSDIDQIDWFKDTTFNPRKIYVVVFPDSQIIFRRIELLNNKELRLATDSNCDTVQLNKVSKIMIVKTIEKNTDSVPTLQMITESSLLCVSEAVDELSKHEGEFVKKLILVFTEFQEHKSFEKMKKSFDEVNTNIKFNRYGFKLNATIHSVIYPELPQ